MKKILKDIKTSTIFIIIGYVLVFGCWLPPLLLALLFKSGDYYILIVLAQITVGAFMLITGSIIKKREDVNPSYRPPKNIFRLFNIWQIFLLISALGFVGSLLAGYYGKEQPEGFFSAVMFLSLLASGISAIIKRIIRYRNRRHNILDVGSMDENLLEKCDRCGKRVLKTDLRMLDSKSYCYECLKKAIEEKNEKIYSEYNTPCSVCKKTFPQSMLFVVDDSYFCEECFQKKYNSDFKGD